MEEIISVRFTLHQLLTRGLLKLWQSMSRVSKHIITLTHMRAVYLIAMFLRSFCVFPSLSFPASCGRWARIIKASRDSCWKLSDDRLGWREQTDVASQVSFFLYSWLLFIDKALFSFIGHLLFICWQLLLTWIVKGKKRRWGEERRRQRRGN